jgi:hypothetical protein
MRRLILAALYCVDVQSCDSLLRVCRQLLAAPAGMPVAAAIAAAAVRNDVCKIPVMQVDRTHFSLAAAHLVCAPVGCWHHPH